MKKFNTTGLCNPRKHYMVNLDSRLKEIKVMVDEGAYMVSFNFNQNKKPGVERVRIGDRVLFEATV